MSAKTIPFKTLPKPVDTWIAAAPAQTARPGKIDGPTKRLTVDIPEDLHRRVKTYCSSNGLQISEVVRELLAAKEFPLT